LGHARSPAPGHQLNTRQKPLVVSATLLSALCALAILSSATRGVRAQQQPGGDVAQEVLDNVAPHPPPDQPIPYSHRTHLALGLPCETCHANGNQAAEMGFPATGTCMGCHASIAAEQPAIMQLAEFSASGELIPWVRVYEVLPGVTWSHGPHAEAGVQCGACHGDVAQSDAMAMTTSVVAMASCVDCHEARGANTACTTCHLWPSE